MPKGWPKGVPRKTRADSKGDRVQVFGRVDPPVRDLLHLQAQAANITVGDMIARLVLAEDERMAQEAADFDKVVDDA